MDVKNISFCLDEQISIARARSTSYLFIASIAASGGCNGFKFTSSGEVMQQQRRLDQTLRIPISTEAASEEWLHRRYCHVDASNTI